MKKATVYQTYEEKESGKPEEFVIVEKVKRCSTCKTNMKIYEKESWVCGECGESKDLDGKIIV